MRKVKILPIFCAIFLLFFTSATSFTGYAAFSPPIDIMSEGVYMVNLDTDIVVVSKNADKRIYPSDLTDIMTCLVALENVKDFEEIVKVPYECTNEFFEGNPNYTNVISAGIEPMQNNLTYWDCMTAMMMRSAAVAANIIAYNVGGSLEHFVEMMNDTATKIGCKNTRFVNAHGCYSENHYTTAYDMYLITRYAIENYPGFMKICNTQQYVLPPNKANPESTELDGRRGYLITHDNAMMSPSSEYYFEGISGVKTGRVAKLYPKKEGKWDKNDFIYGSRSLVTTAERNGYKYLLVSLGAPYYDENGEAPEKAYSYTDHINLYNWVFSEFEYKQIIGNNQMVMQVDVENGENADKIGIVTTEDYWTLIPKSLDSTAIQMICPTVETMTAPIDKGTKVGELELKLNGETLARIPLETDSNINLDPVASYREKLAKILKSPIVIILICVVAALIIAIVALRIIVKSKNKKRAELQRRRKIQMAPRRTNNNRRPNNRR